MLQFHARDRHRKREMISVLSCQNTSFYPDCLALPVDTCGVVIHPPVGHAQVIQYAAISNMTVISCCKTYLNAISFLWHYNALFLSAYTDIYSCLMLSCISEAPLEWEYLNIHQLRSWAFMCVCLYVQYILYIYKVCLCVLVTFQTQ